MTDLALNQETLRASKAAALLTEQVRRDLEEAGDFRPENLDLVAGQIAAALITGSFEYGGRIGPLAARLCA